MKATISKTIKKSIDVKPQNSQRERGQQSAGIGWRLVAGPMQSGVFEDLSFMVEAAPHPGPLPRGEGTAVVRHGLAVSCLASAVGGF